MSGDWGGVEKEAVGGTGEELGGRREVGTESFHPQLALAARSTKWGSSPTPLPPAVRFPARVGGRARQWGFTLEGRAVVGGSGPISFP